MIAVKDDISCRLPATELTRARAMRIRFTRLTNERHRFEIVRDDGSREAHDLETRSTLAHDLAHYVVETEAGLRQSFYGRLAAGTTYAELTELPPQDPEVMQTERVVVMLQTGFKQADRSSQETFAKTLHAFEAVVEAPPPWLTAEVMQRMLERLRRVHGRWRATPFHHALELNFP
jgi:hypothetical protein